MGKWANQAVSQTKMAFQNAGNKTVARGAANYMKSVSPFLGISAPKRNKLQKKAWQDLEIPSESELLLAASTLWKLPEREYQYAGADLIGKFIQVCTLVTLNKVKVLITSKSWWDSVDNLGSKVISPLTLKFPQSRKIIKLWSNSKNIWLIRAAIQHQRGHKENTDVDFVISLCQRHVNNPEFFVSKAIGWALRDLTKIDAWAVKIFLRENPKLNKVALREAQKGLNRI
jgi:3-methyladenine DNA glycosylase AlkD